MKQFLLNHNINFENGKIKLKETTTKVMIDIGLSYNAPQSNLWLNNQKNLQVFGFEPFPENINNILSKNNKKRHPSHGEPLNYEYIKNKSMQIIPCALSNKETNMNFYITSKDSGCSSLYKPKTFNIQKIINVPVFTLKQFFDLFPWDKIEYIDYIKIDAQGSDLDILKGAENYLKERIIYITAEPDGNQYENADHCNRNDIKNYMTSIGFIQVNHRNTIDPTFLNKKFLQKKDIYIKQT